MKHRILQTNRMIIPTILRMALILGFLATALFTHAPAAFAQQPSGNDPQQSPSPQPTPPWEAGLPNGQLIKLMDNLRSLVPYIRRQVERPLLEKFNLLAMVLASLILLFSFIRIIRENDGASTELYYWFGRAAICMMLFAIAPSIISSLYRIGRTLTIPINAQIEEKRVAFNDQYYAFIHGHFVVRDDKQVWEAAPRQVTWVGILTNHEAGNGSISGIDSIEKATNLTSWDMPEWLFGLNVARGILQTGEIFLLLLSGFIMIALRLAVPFMVAVAVDKKLAERITYPFIWGTVVFTMIFPVVRDVLTYIAYTVGSFGLALYDGVAPYTIDERTAQILKNNPYDPTIVIVITLVILIINGLMLWVSPYLAYRISTGQVFEAVSSTASGWMAAIVGSAVEFTGLKAGAALQRQAENTQTQSAYQAEMTRAKGSLETSNLGANARRISSVAGIEAARVGSIGQIVGGATTQRGMAQQGANFTVAATRAQVADSNRQMWGRAYQSIDQTLFSAGAESHRIATESQARKTENWGSAFGGAVSGVPVAGPIAQSLITPNYNGVANTDRTRGLNYANNAYANNTMGNEMKTAKKVDSSQFSYQHDMEDATSKKLAGDVAAIDAGAGTAIGAANRGAAISKGGVQQAYSIELQANKVQFATAQTAAGQIKTGNLEASHLRELSTIITGVARDMDRRIEEGMRQRY